MHSDQEGSVGTGGTEPQQDLRVYPGLRYSRLAPDPPPLPFSLYWKYEILFQFKLGHFSHRFFAEYLMIISLYTVASAPCVLSNSSFLFPTTNKADLLKNFRGRSPVQYVHCTIQRNNFGPYPLKILHFQLLLVLLSICNLSLGVALVITDRVACLGGLCVSVYMCVCICVWVCVLPWRGWDWHDRFPSFFLIFRNII